MKRGIGGSDEAVKMPARSDIRSIMIIGSGPITIGQACEFDYSGTQAVRALKKLGYRVILVNSNPATIMTDPELADVTYLEPLTWEMIREIIAREPPDALLSTMGGQTALNLARELYQHKVLQTYGVELIGARFDTIDLAEDRGKFQDLITRLGLEVPKGQLVSSVDEGVMVAQEIGFPLILRPAYTLGGTGGSIVYNRDELQQLLPRGLASSPVGKVLVEESLWGYKEFELEVMRDREDNAVVVCSIENFDPLGIHTGDSITVAPAQTLTDKEYQRMRDAALAIMRATGVEAGGANIQFAVHPHSGRMVVIEMNPRVSRSSALASKATGFPIAKIAAQLAVGMTLGEITNEVTGASVSAFEPTLDYVVVKIPRWHFEKFSSADPTLGPQMKSVGEVMAIGRTFPEAFQKALRSLEVGRYGFGGDGKDPLLPERIEAHLRSEWREMIRRRLRVPDPQRVFFLRYAMALDIPVSDLAQLTGIDPWFLSHLEHLVSFQRLLAHKPFDRAWLMEAKRLGLSDRQIAFAWGCSESEVERFRRREMVYPSYHMVDTCAGEFRAQTPYFYSTYGEEDEAEPLAVTGGEEGTLTPNRDPWLPLILTARTRGSIVVIGAGPNRIGQGIEFDYCCVHATEAFREQGYRVIMINCNPETVSTDYDIADRLYFEPLTEEDVTAICEHEKPVGVAVQFGGNTSLKLARPLFRRGFPLLGTSVEAIESSEDRGRFARLLQRLGIVHPPFGVAGDLIDAVRIAEHLGYPVLVRPSFVLGGRAMEVVYSEEELRNFFIQAEQVSDGSPVLIDRFIEDAFEFDLDGVADEEEVRIAGIMQHIEEAGIHSGDSACVLPAYMLNEEVREEMKRIARLLAQHLKVVGLFNLQFAFRDGQLYLLEANLRASRTIPFVSKAVGVPWAKVAARAMVGVPLREQDLPDDPQPSHRCVKAVKFPFARFEGISYFLGPEMRSTGEVMGIGRTFGEAFWKAQLAVDTPLPLEGGVFISVNDRDKERVIPIARQLHDLGFKLWATQGTHRRLTNEGLPAQLVYKVNEGRPNVVDRIKNGEIVMVINTPLGRESHFDERAVGAECYRKGIPNITTLSGAWAAVQAIGEILRRGLKPQVRAIQEVAQMVTEPPSREVGGEVKGMPLPFARE